MRPSSPAAIPGAIHIRFAIQGSPKRLIPNDEGSSLPNAHVAQLYFTKAVADDVFNAMPIYKQGAPITKNEDDSIHSGNGDKDLIVEMTKMGASYLGEVEIGVKRSQIGK